MDVSGVASVRARLERLKSTPATTTEEARAALDALFGGYPLPDDTQVMPVRVGNLAAEWIHVGAADPDRAILYLHGGAYVRGSLRSHRPLAARISEAAGIRVLLLEYRLAPEHPFPAALKDALTAYRWLLAGGTAPEHVALAGDSAGGGLAIATLLALRDAGQPLPSGAAVMSPWTDLAATGTSPVQRADLDPWLTPERLEASGSTYLNGADAADPLASPVYADLHGLPPLLVQVGTDEIIYDDSTRLAERAEAAGTAVTLRIWEGMWHVFQAFGHEVPEGRQAIGEIGAFVRERTGAPMMASAKNI